MSSGDVESDDAFLKMLASGVSRDQSWNQLLERYQGRLFLFACGLTGDPVLAEEVVHECFVELWKSVVINKIEIRNLRAWLYKLASRKGMAQIQERRKAMPTLEPAQLNSATHTRENERDSDREELLSHVYSQVNLLPDRLRMPILLHFGSGLSQIEIAAVLDCRQSTVSERIGEALEQLKSSLSSLGFVVLPLPLTSLLSSTLESPPPALLSPLKLKAISPQTELQAKQGTSVLSAKGVAVAALTVVAVVVTAILVVKRQPANSPPVQPSSVAPSTQAEVKLPEWASWKIAGFTTPGRNSGTWTLQQGPEVPTALSFLPQAKVPQVKNYCYVKGQYQESLEWQGSIELPGDQKAGWFELGLIHPNQINCSTMEWNFAREHFPIRFRIQVWHDEMGTRVAIHLKTAMNQEDRSHDLKEWRLPPWDTLSQKNETVWMKFKDMHTFGFMLTANSTLKFSELQIRPLVSEHLIHPLE